MTKQYYHFTYYFGRHVGDEYVLAGSVEAAWKMVRKSLRRRHPGRTYNIQLVDY